jgi:hypothetical protein
MVVEEWGLDAHSYRRNTLTRSMKMKECAHEGRMNE